MTRRDEKRLAALVAKAQRHYATAIASYQRYARRPDTATGTKDHARFTQHYTAATELMADILAQLHAGGAPQEGA